MMETEIYDIGNVMFFPFILFIGIDTIYLVLVK